MVTGEWTGTMNLTEPHAGSDLGALTTRAEQQADGTYRIFGTKIFITYGDHEMTDNIIHLVLARLPDAPPGTRGISLFLVPKYLVNKDGSLGARNDVICAGLEHKLGIHASPTCVMKYGEKDGAIGYLVGEENRGLNVMFIMMNAARLAVGMQGVAVAERATQRALAYAKERRRAAPPRPRAPTWRPIIEHPDIRRSLMTMKALTQAARAICLVTARETDVARRAKDAAERAAAANRVALLTPDRQGLLHRHRLRGGLDRRAGARRHGLHRGDRRGAASIAMRASCRSTRAPTASRPSTSSRASCRWKAARWSQAYIGELQKTVDEVRASNRPEFGRMGERLGEAVAALAEATRWMGGSLQKNPEAALAGATPYLRLFGLAAGGVYLARGALAAARNGVGAAHAQPIAIARFFAENLATAAPGLKDTVISGADFTLGAGARGVVGVIARISS